jgi:cytochrome c oxidase cbb3-type subunit 3
MSSRFAERARGGLLVGLLCAALGACKRERRPFHDSPPEAAAAETASAPRPAGTRESAKDMQLYGGNAYALNDGKRLYAAFNCVGCHAHGGGGMGPALMDSAWIYGIEPAKVYATIANGRPNGMPAFRERIPPSQIWELVAYVRSMSGQGSKAARPNRSDEMEVRPAEAQTTTQKPVQAKPDPAATADTSTHP